MFKQKQKSLITVKPKKAQTGVSVAASNAFLKEAEKTTSVTRSGNGAKKYSTSGDIWTDQFAAVSLYKEPRNYEEIQKDMSSLWGHDPLKAMKFAFYLRTITRKVKLLNGNVTAEAQQGSELRWESIMRYLWVSQKNPQAFKENLDLFVALGSWKDVFQMLQYDLVYHGWDKRILDWDFMGKFILSGLSNNQTSELVKKYLPQIKSKAACKSVESQANNIISKWICSLLFGTKDTSKNTYKQYRQLKASGTAHQWQQLISQRKFDLIQFDQIHGRALQKLVKSQFLFNQGLSEKYKNWITAPTTSDVKYTGFVYELFPTHRSFLKQNGQEETINKQFETIVNKVDKDLQTKFIVVRDTSGSMGSNAIGTNVPANHIAKSLALYFSEFLKGTFSNSYIEFNSSAKLIRWKGSTPVEKFYNDSACCIGNTNFQSVIDLFVEMKRKGVAEEEFPTGILCLSDGEFDPATLGQTNVEHAKQKLSQAGFSNEYCNNFVIVLWNIPNGYYSPKPTTKFDTYGNVPNVFYFAGMNGSIISFLTGKIMNASELFEAAMNQEVLNMIKIP